VAVFGAVVAALVPLILTVFAIVVAVALAALIGQISPLSFVVLNMLTFMGLAVGIDYSLFIVSRYRDERREGHGKHEAIGLAGMTAIRAVLFSGMTVVLALSPAPARRTSTTSPSPTTTCRSCSRSFWG